MRDWSRCDPLAIAQATVARAVRELDPQALDPARAEQLVETFASIERLAAAGKSLAASRVASSGAWRARGERSSADWLARTTGSSVAAARAALDTAERLADAPGTEEAFRAGRLSVPQAEAIAAAATVDPAAESRLLDMAAQQSLQKVRDEAARVRAAAEPDPAARHARIRRGRFWRRWTDAEGARCGQYRLTPEDGAAFEAAAQRFIDEAYAAAREAGRDEPAEAHAADGLVAMAATTRRQPGDGAGEIDAGGDASGDGRLRRGRGRRRTRDRRELIGIVNLESLRRGSVAAGEMCEIAGIGPVPVETARAIFGDALLRIVIRDGVDIRTVVHARHQPSAVQETAVLVRDGGRCVRPSCGRPIAEIDHIEEYASTRRTTLDELAGLCTADHDRKTYGGHRYERGARGWEWHRPDGGIEYERPPPPDDG